MNKKKIKKPTEREIHKNLLRREHVIGGFVCGFQPILLRN